MIVITIAFVSGIPAAYMPESLNAETSHAYHAQVSFISVVCRSSDSSIQAARLIAAYDLAPYCQRIASAFSPGHDSPSNDRFSPHAGISRMENNTLELQLLSESCRVLAILNVQTADPATDSFRVRDLHPIPLFSEQACVSDCSGRACATKAMLFSCLQGQSLDCALRSFYIYAHKKTSPALRSRRQKKSRILYIFSFGVRKNYLFI